MSGDRGGDRRSEKESDSYLEKLVGAAWIGPGTASDEVKHIGAETLKTAALFMPGKIGWGASIVLGGADQAKPGDSWGMQAIDGSLGMAKGGLMRGVMSMRMQGDLATRAITLGVSNRIIDSTLNRSTVINPETHELDIAGGIKSSISKSFNPYSLGMDVATFGLAEGTLRIGNRLTDGLLTRRPLYANVFTGASFGFGTGSAGEAQQEWTAGEKFDLAKILRAGAIQGTLGGIAAAPGGMMREYSLKHPQFIVIGGGPHGVEQALQISEVLGRDKVTIVDPNPQLMGRWKHVTGNTEMTHLRSPKGHYLGSEPLDKYAQRSNIPEERAFAEWPPSLSAQLRPSLRLFNSHADAQIRNAGIDQRHMQTTGDALEIRPNGVRVKTDIGTIHGDYVIMAMGSGEGSIPRFAQQLRAEGKPVNHIFDPDFKLNDVQRGESVAVVGGGITAAQTAIGLAKRGHPVTLITRQPIKEAALDFPRQWATYGSRYLLDGLSPTERREVINANRNKGTVPPYVMDELNAQLRSGMIRHQIVPEVTADGVRPFDRVVLATGFESGRPGGALVDNAVSQYGLPVAPDGFPVVNGQLQWHPRVWVSGPLAELSVGPASRNIVGAQLAAQRIRPLLEEIASAKSTQSTRNTPQIPDGVASR